MQKGRDPKGPGEVREESGSYGADEYVTYPYFVSQYISYLAPSRASPI